MLFRKKEYISSSSLSALAWRRFKRNWTGVGSMVFIGLILVIALLGYLITPDTYSICQRPAP